MAMTDEKLNDAGDGALDELASVWQGEAVRLAELSDDELLVAMGKQLPPLDGEPLGAIPSPAFMIRRAKSWIDSHRAKICSALRRSAKVRAFITNRKAYDLASAAALIAGALVAYLADVVLPFPLTLAVILLRLGLETTCGSDWSIPSPD